MLDAKKYNFRMTILTFFLLFSFVYLFEIVVMSTAYIETIIFVGLVFLMTYYNVYIYVDDKEFEIKNNMIKIGFILIILPEIFLWLLDTKSYSGLATEILLFYKKYDFYFVLTLIGLFFFNKKFKTNFINSCIDIFIIILVFYFVVSILLFMIEPLKDSSLSSLIKEITNSKVHIVEYQLTFTINSAISQLTIFFMLSYVVILLMKQQRIHYMTYNNYFFKLLQSQWHYLKKSFNNPIKYKRNKTIKKAFEELNQQRAEHFKDYIKNEKKLIDDELNNIRFRMFKFINTDLYQFLQGNKKYLLFYAFYFEIINGSFVYFFDNSNFNNYFNEQVYFLFIIISMLCVFEQNDFLKKFKENKDNIILNILIISAICIIQDYLYNITKIYIFNTFIIVLLYSMRDNFIVNNIFKRGFYIVFSIYTIYNFIGFFVINNTIQRESIIFFYSIIFFIFINKEFIYNFKNIIYKSLKV